MLTPRVFFLHVPKTGGTWATQALIAAGVPCRAVEIPSRNHYAEHGHVWLADIVPDERLLSVAFVRHPLDWWRSVWAHRMREGWLFPNHEIDSRASSTDFAEFVEMVIEHLPGFLDGFFERFTGPPERPIAFVGRFERLVDDLVLALRLAGEPFDEVALRTHPPQNVGTYDRFAASYDPELARALAISEQRTIDRFYAGEVVPTCFLPIDKGRRATRAHAITRSPRRLGELQPQRGIISARSYSRSLTCSSQPAP